MSSYTTELVTLPIANGQTTSSRLSDVLSAGQLKTLLGALEQFSIRTPGTLTGASVAVQVAAEAPGTTFQPLNDQSGNDITLVAAEMKTIPFVTFSDLRLVSASAEGALRNFDIIVKLKVG